MPPQGSRTSGGTRACWFLLFHVEKKKRVGVPSRYLESSGRPALRRRRTAVPVVSERFSLRPGPSLPPRSQDLPNSHRKRTQKGHRLQAHYARANSGVI